MYTAYKLLLLSHVTHSFLTQNTSSMGLTSQCCRGRRWSTSCTPPCWPQTSPPTSRSCSWPGLPHSYYFKIVFWNVFFRSGAPLYETLVVCLSTPILFFLIIRSYSTIDYFFLIVYLTQILNNRRHLFYVSLWCDLSFLFDLKTNKKPFFWQPCTCDGNLEAVLPETKKYSREAVKNLY